MYDVIIIGAGPGGIFTAYELTKINSDFYAWIECEDVEISLPVVKTTNAEQEDFYLEHDFEKYKNPLGVPYQKHNCAIETTTNSVFVGHSTYDMHWYNKLSQLHIFGNFLNYLTTSDHSGFNYTIKVQTLDKTYTYKIVSAYNYSTTNFNYEQTLPYTTSNISNQEQFDTFYTTIKKLSKINTQTTAEYGDNFLTIYTCSKNDMKSRVIVVAKLIQIV